MSVQPLNERRHVAVTRVTAVDVFRAVADGYNTAAQIAARTGVARSTIANYCKVMSEIGLLDREVELHRSDNGTKPGLTAVMYVYRANHRVARKIEW